MFGIYAEYIIFYENISIIHNTHARRDERSNVKTRESLLQTFLRLTSSGSITSNGNAFHRSEWLVILLWYAIVYLAYNDSVRYVTGASPDDYQYATWSCAFYLLLNYGELLFSLSLLAPSRHCTAHQRLRAKRMQDLWYNIGRYWLHALAWWGES